ncbi:MAG: hypothetical protein V9H26_12555 [Verrucomicrobiota bacterium]
MGYNHQQVLALFRNPHYLGPNMAFEKRGEPFIRDLIADVFARWGKVVTWPVAAGILPAVEPGFQPGGPAWTARRPGKFEAAISSRRRSGRQDAALYGRQDARRYRPDRRADS